MENKKPWTVGDRVSYAASPHPMNRTVYTGTVEAVENGLCKVREDYWCTIYAVAATRLHPAGSYEITPSGPVGIFWKA